DTIEESIAVQGVLVRLIDTAGIRGHADRLEAAGIARTERALLDARIALLVFDGSRPVDTEVLALLDRTADRPRIVFWNKADIGDEGARQLDESAAVVGSVRYPETLAAVRAAIALAGWGGEAPDLERPHLAALREFDAVNVALGALANAQQTIAANEPIDLAVPELQRAFQVLGHLTGDEANEELLDAIFARFCIGK
ncbi:MAG: GTPase, partial [Rhodanobacteraceae bacterium]